MNSRACVLLAPLLLALGACAVMEPPPLPEGDVPERFIGPVVEESAVWPNTDWWNNFNDAELSAFIEEVKANNLDLANNRRNLESAQIALREAGLARWPTPQLTIGDATGYSRTSLDGATVSMIWRAVNVAMASWRLLTPRTAVVASSHQRSIDKKLWA